MIKKRLFILISLVAMSSAFSEEHQMVQSDKVFLGNIPDKELKELWDNPAIEKKYKVKKMKAKLGDVIHFKNRDEVNHNVSGKIGDKKVFDVALQKTGALNDKKIKLTKKGKYTVKCAIHPKMSFSIEVE